MAPGFDILRDDSGDQFGETFRIRRKTDPAAAGLVVFDLGVHFDIADLQHHRSERSLHQGTGDEAFR